MLTIRFLRMAFSPQDREAGHVVTLVTLLVQQETRNGWTEDPDDSAAGQTVRASGSTGLGGA